ncbi:MAG: BTAD domain-containing putative transcriptional regulator [bacterium]
MGRFAVTVDGEQVPQRAFGGRLAARLLRILAAHRGTVVTRDYLIEALWPTKQPARPGANLNALVNRVRRALEDDGSHIVTVPEGYVLDVHPDTVDLERLARAVARGLDLVRSERPDEALAVLAPALESWAEPLPEDRYDDWADPVRRELDTVHRDGLERAAEAALRVGDPAAAETFARRAAGLDETRESSARLLARALAMGGDRAGALDVLDDHRRRLASALGLDPSPDAVATRDAILRGDPDHMISTGTAAYHDAPGVPHPVDELIGRRHELKELEALAASARLVTITGPGGIGKTRLAVEIAWRSKGHRPTFVCSLEHVDPGVVPYAVAHAVDAVDAPGAAMIERVVAALRDQDALLVLDGCDTVLQPVTSLTANLLAGCSRLTILLTSRERTGLPAEHTRRLDPLPLDDDGTTGGSPAVRLFAQRAAAADAAFDPDDEATRRTVREICASLDGVPLAIELAAGQLAAMSLADLHERLDHRLALLTRSPGKAALADAVDSSYELLTEAERRALARLAVFPSDFALNSGEQVASPDGPPDLIPRLVDKSLVSRSGPRRYRLLETTRLYARRRLEERGGIGDAYRAHAAWSVSRAVQAAHGLRGADEARWVSVVRSEIDDLRQAHRWAVDHGSLDDALELAATVPSYAQWRLAPELFDWALEAASLEGSDNRPAGAAAAGAAALGMTNRGRLREAERLAHRALAVADTVGDPTAALRALCLVALYEGDREACHRFGADLEERAGAVGDRFAVVDSRIIRAAVEVFSGGDDALGRARDARADAERLGNPSLLALANEIVGEALHEREPDEALAMFDRALGLADLVSCRLVAGLALLASSSTLIRLGRVPQAAARCRSAVLHWRRAGNTTHQWTTLRNAAELLAGAGRRRDADLILRAAAAGGAPEPYGLQAERLAELSSRLRREFGDDVPAGQEPDLEGAVRTAVDALESLG